MRPMKQVSATDLEANCSKLIEGVAVSGEAIEVTKRGKVLVRIVPARPRAELSRSIFGAAKHRILYLAPEAELMSAGDAWNAER
jgi:prevent-host-death family protein